MAWWPELVLRFSRVRLKCAVRAQCPDRELPFRAARVHRGTGRKATARGRERACTAAAAAL